MIIATVNIYFLTYFIPQGTYLVIGNKMKMFIMFIEKWILMILKWR